MYHDLLHQSIHKRMKLLINKYEYFCQIFCIIIRNEIQFQTFYNPKATSHQLSAKLFTMVVTNIVTRMKLHSGSTLLFLKKFYLLDSIVFQQNRCFWVHFLMNCFKLLIHLVIVYLERSLQQFSANTLFHCLLK